MSVIQETLLKTRVDERGSLVAIEGQRDVPFDIKRVYYIFGSQPHVRRGGHAHYRLKQMAVCVAGSCRFLMDDGIERRTHVLDRQSRGLIIDPMVWHEMDNFSPDCVLLVLADAVYDRADYISDYGEFLTLAHARQSAHPYELVA